jgi:glutathione-regulated potassium-efflux system ancillary protein KefF
VAYLIYAHPYPRRSHANQVLFEAVRGLDGVEARSLYDSYPDFAIDVEAEQAALAAATTIVWHHPLYWYSVPPLLKLWFDQVLTHGWAYGPGGTALVGKRVLWVVTTGGGPDSYAPGGEHEHPFEVFIPPIRQTARFCGMEWLEPIIVHSAGHTGRDELAVTAARYQERLRAAVADEYMLAEERAHG